MFPDLFSIIEQNRRSNPDARAIVDDAHELTWDEFVERVIVLRRALAASGVRRCDRVAVIEDSCADYVALHYALAGLGAVMVPLNSLYRPHELSYVLSDCQPKLVIAGARFEALIREALLSVYKPVPIVWRDKINGLCRGDRSWKEFLHASNADVAESRADTWNDIHLILYTSGTTGRPKGVMLSQRRTILDAISAIAAFGVRPGDSFFCYLPLFHTGGWDYIKQYLFVGGSIVLTARFDAGSALRKIQKFRCNAIFGVPLVLRKLLEHADFEAFDASSMRLIAYGSYDPSDFMNKVLASFKARGARGLQLAHAYGLTEAGPFVSILRPEAALDHLASIGTPPPGVLVNLLDDDGNPVPDGQVGEICVRSPALMDGYWNNKSATEEAFANGCLHTGDLARIVNGLLYIVDRKKDMIRTGGENVFAKEVEEVLVSHPAIRDCAVLGMPDTDYGERVTAIVVAEPDHALSEGTVRDFARVHLAGYKVPREVVFVDQIPKTPAGKTSKYDLRQTYGGTFQGDRT